MKTAIYIEDGVVQLVLTPESEFEKNALNSFNTSEGVTAEIFSGAFYDCRGGWTRQKSYYGTAYGDNNDKSLILRSTPRPTPTSEP